MSNSDTLVSLPSLSTCEKLHHLHFEVGEHWNRHHSSMLFLNVFPEWFVASLFVYIINILRTSLENVFFPFESNY